MLPVEGYVTVDKKALQDALSSDSYLPFQGENLLFTQGWYSFEDVYTFLEHVFHIVGKIAVLNKGGEYVIISDKFTPEAKEPFASYEDATNTFNNNLKKMAEHISFGSKTYEVS